MASSKRILLAAVLAVTACAAACSGGGSSRDSADDDDGTATPTPAVNPYEVCVAHFEQDVGDAPEVANLLLVVLRNEYWVGASQDVVVDGLNGAIYADYHYEFGNPVQPPEYVGAISTSATVTVTSSNNQIGTAATIEIQADPLWFITTTAGTLSGGAGAANGVLQPLAGCPGSCDFGTGSVSILVNASALTLSTANADTVALLYCRDLPAAFASWRPGRPLPPGFREAFR